MRRTLTLILSLLFLFSLSACGKKAEQPPVPETTLDTTGMELALVDWSMNATTWSSPNGATVNITATPTFHKDSHCAEFMVILNQQEVFRDACTWNGSSYICSADLNAANGYGYYIVLTDTDGTEILVAVNTAESPLDETLINMESALDSYATLTVTDSAYKGGKLTIRSADAQVQLTSITQTAPVSISEAFLILTYEGAEADRVSLPLPAGASGSFREMSIQDISLDVPKMEDDQRLDLSLEVVSSDGQIITAPGGTWHYSAGDLLSSVG